MQMKEGIQIWEAYSIIYMYMYAYNIRKYTYNIYICTQSELDIILVDYRILVFCYTFYFDLSLD